MKTIAADTELDLELQELYILSNHWISDIHFAEDEMKFLKHMLNKYLVTSPKKGVSNDIENFNKAIELRNANISTLKNKISELLKFIGPLVTGTGEKIGIDLIEKFTVLETEMKTLFESVKQLKRSLFSFTEEVMRAQCDEFTKQF
jgi:hypothetical protein